MQLVQLSRLRQATRPDIQDLQALPLFAQSAQRLPEEGAGQPLLVRFFHLLHDAEKQLLPFFAKMTREEFDWMNWLLSPELGYLLASRYQFLPRPSANTGMALNLTSLPQALGSAWALLHVNAQVAQLFPANQARGLNTRLLQQLEALVQIYCSNPADIMETQAAAKATLKALSREIQSWGWAETEPGYPLEASA
ncbi:hypothetical protein [Marinospirillum sp.]|uniref:hypothetical protein n=1 Tax=Marinospirillum sp. TaxID=2183934 RepID=UPI00286FD521|nr:hypothetical protein [Marinospirillum sp.]MDR9468736.1 hypothetical protein [Marinospirillum sp.]